MLIYIPHSIFTASGGYLVEDILTEEESLELDAGGQTEPTWKSIGPGGKSIRQGGKLSLDKTATLLLIAEYKTFFDKLEKGKIKKK